MSVSRLSLFAVALIAAGVVCAAEPKLRALSTDRPDSTESPFTVDPGHVQVEMDVANYGRTQLDGAATVEWEAAPFNLRWGVTKRTELGVFVTPFRRVSETPRGGPRVSHSGFGDLTLRGKWNLEGNEGGDFGWGLMADLKLPTATRPLGNGKLEGAVTLPIAFELGGGWGGGAMTSVELRYTGASHRAVWSNTLTFARDLTERVGGFLEVTSEAGDGSHVATFNCGLTRALNEVTQLDCGINLGISRTAPDLRWFAGWSRKY